jgi:hypothetical protein
MRQNTPRWIAGLAIVLFVAGSAWMLYRLAPRVDQELDIMAFDVEIALDQYPMPFSNPEGRRCPVALADGEAGTVRLTVTNGSAAPHTLALDYGDCHINLAPGETVDATCTVRADNPPDDVMKVQMFPIDSAYTIYNPRHPVCNIPMVNVGSLDGQPGLIVTFLPGVIGLLLGAALWILGRQAANRDLQVLTITGAVLALAELLAVLFVTFSTNVSLRANALIVLAAASALLFVALLIQLLAVGMMIGWRRAE